MDIKRLVFIEAVAVVQWLMYALDIHSWFDSG